MNAAISDRFLRNTKDDSPVYRPATPGENKSKHAITSTQNHHKIATKQKTTHPPTKNRQFCVSSQTPTHTTKNEKKKKIHRRAQTKTKTRQEKERRTRRSHRKSDRPRTTTRRGRERERERSKRRLAGESMVGKEAVYTTLCMPNPQHIKTREQKHMIIFILSNAHFRDKDNMVILQDLLRPSTPPPLQMLNTSTACLCVCVFYLLPLPIPSHPNKPNRFLPDNVFRVR